MQLRFRSYGMIALIICLVEIVGIWGTTAVLVQMPQKNYLWLVRPMATLYLVGFTSIPISVIGLVKDKRRILASLALALGIGNVLICGFRFIAV